MQNIYETVLKLKINIDYIKYKTAFTRGVIDRFFY